MTARKAATREARLAAENAQLEARNGELQAQNAELHARLQQREGENWGLDAMVTALRGELAHLGGRPEGPMVQWNMGQGERRLDNGSCCI